MFIDWTYVVYVVPAVLIAMFFQFQVNHTFAKYKKVRNSSGLTGADAARKILDANGLQNIRIERVNGKLTDHYDPTANVIRLSEEVYDSPTAAAVGVAAHETGHAIQHAVGYGPMKLRSAIIPITNFMSNLAMPLFLIGLLLSSISAKLVWVAYVGVIFFSSSFVFQLVTLPTEFNASSRALATIKQQNLLTEEERGGARKVLSAAAMTYVAALGVSLMSIIRLLVILGSRSGRDD